MKKTKRIKVFGEVQGVNFRAATQKEARELGLGGYVKNMPDGSVLIEVSGDETKLERLAGWCRQGPPAADVTDIETSAATYREFSDFTIRY